MRFRLSFLVAFAALVVLIEAHVVSNDIANSVSDDLTENHPGKVSGCFYNICTHVDNYPIEAILKALEERPEYKFFFDSPEKIIEEKSPGDDSDTTGKDSNSNIVGGSDCVFNLCSKADNYPVEAIQKAMQEHPEYLGFFDKIRRRRSASK